MFNFFRRSKSNRSTDDHQPNPKKLKKQQPEKKSSSIGIESCASQPNKYDINKTSRKNGVEIHEEKSNINVFVPNDQYEKKENSSRNKIVDLKQCRNDNDPKRSIIIDRSNINHQHHQQQQQQQQQHQEQNSRHQSFNPINRSREFFYEIMAKGRNRKRNRNKTIDYQRNQQQKQIQKQNSTTIQHIDQCQPTFSDMININKENANSFNINNEKNNEKTLENIEENFGYQITKSKNRTNLVTDYEIAEDENENNDNDLTTNKNVNKSTSDVENCEENCAGACENVKTSENRNVFKNDIVFDQKKHNYRHHQKQYETNEYDHDHTDKQYDGRKRSRKINDHEKIENSEKYVEHLKEWQLPKNKFISQNVDIHLNDEVVIEQLSDVIECDRDRNFNTKIKMGQPNSKKSRGASRQGRNLIIPTITIADYSDQTDNGNGNGNGNGSEPDVFYDSSESFDVDDDADDNDNATGVDTNYNVTNDIDDNDENEEIWHFEPEPSVSGVLPTILESDDIEIADDGDSTSNNNNNNNNNNENENDPVKTVNSNNNDNDNINTSNNDNLISNSENISTSSTSSNLLIDKEKTDSPDSGIESVSGQSILIDSNNLIDDRNDLLNINRDSELFLRDSSTDCDDNFLPSDFDIKYDRHFHNDQEHYHVIIDSISLPDVVVDSNVMGNNISTKFDHIDDKSSTIIITDHNENNTRNLVNQEARFSAQLEDAQKLVYNAQTKVNELQAKIDNLEKELSIKSWNEDRLQAELLAAHKEDDCVRRRLKLLEDEMVALKQRYSETEDEYNRRYDNLETEHDQLQEKYHQLQSLASTLQTQLACAQSDTEQCRREKDQLIEEKDEELKVLKEALEKSHQERTTLEEKWQKEFELLRTQNADREDHLMTDCEWQLRAMQRNCKDKIENAERAKFEAIEKVEEFEINIEEKLEEIQRLKPYEAEVRGLRGLTSDQRESLLSMTDQLEDLREELQTANSQLEEQINNVRKIRIQCDNALSDKDRQMIQKIEDTRFEVATQWESRLLTEMQRLTQELESVHMDDRREALDRLQTEHIEEIKVLTSRYDEMEEELREEMTTLREQLKYKSQELIDLQTRTDYALVQTRMHLDKADRDYQFAMSREVERRETLTEKLKGEFDKEKQEMEEKFRERLGHVKDEFAKELTNATQDMAARHRKQLEQQWDQLIVEKEEALSAMESRHRIRLEETENRIIDIGIQHQRDLKEIKNNYEIERTSLESRDLQNSQEIEQLHRKCRCLTNLFEEMRMRYERREPRPEDLSEISELRERCESQERDLHILTERLREIQIEQQEQQELHYPPPRKTKTIKKPPPKTIPTSCDVIYEENEDRESPAKDISNTNGSEDFKKSKDSTNIMPQIENVFFQS